MSNKEPITPPEGKVDGKILVALSGGADSVYLFLHLLNEGTAVEAVHCNFRLRGEESDRDEEFCKRLCERKGVKLHLAHFDTKEYAKLHKISIELAARQLRYKYFEQLRQDIGAQFIAVAHHKDDQAETIIHNIVRGTGIKGLCGMRKQNGNIIRPLLDITRVQIEEQLAAWGETFVTDSTNLEDDATRNKIRHNIIPLLKEINPKAVENIARMAQHLTETAEIEDSFYKTLEARFEKGELQATDYTEGFLNFLLSPKGFNGSQIQNILKALHCPETKMFLSKDFVVDICRKQLYISPRIEDTFVEKITPSGNLMRRPKVGDRFKPKHFKGTKLLSDYLNEKKLTPAQKRQVVVVENQQGEIIDVII
ncbi:MAG: tRNA lysidine(34) synthetase TilS [Bacteroidaceae bacterium]|nr:tRNA lysidine(34) synthetase TilS [Bacteroidaceae bacterium]MCF0243780.1 tRNA lysidine(34) synthetase TilS [Bacteroidaceae bacterium]